MSAYMVILFATVWLFRHHPPTGTLAWMLAVLPALPVIGAIWAVMRLLVEEEDEYLRSLMVRQAMFATGFCLCISTVWEFLQNFDLVPQGTDGFGPTFLWFMGLGLGAIYYRLTDRDSACIP